jgi:uncharacterized protein
MSYIELNDQIIKSILENSGTIAVIGCSDKKYRTSYHIADYLQRAGYRIIPVNPNIREALNEKSYDSMNDLPAGQKIDIVNIFRNKKYTADMLRQIIEWSDKTGQKPLIWTQLDVSTNESMKLAEAAGLKYVENRCLMVEHQRLSVE